MMSRQKGFTLIEMLATIALIAIAMSGATVFFSNNSPDQRLKSQIQKFITYADHASDFAMVKNETWGLILTPPKWRSDPLEMGWEFRWQKLELEYDEGLNLVSKKWVDIDGLESIELPAEVEMNVTIEEVEWKWDKKPEGELLPQVLFYSSGDITRFEFEVVLDMGFAEPQHIEVDEWGGVSWRQQREMEEELAKELGNN